MYLSKLEIVGFKSFANRTVLDFGPGMTAIVGPNGCGKSNLSDAIRWVLGEQSAKAMRGSKMQDCIFDGADTKKPFGMAEVSLSMSDCEEILGVDYNEVTVTRRVFRSGESEYLINKRKCRLKDIQRLFMDTGVGTHSYSVMEQGRIDYILSARPEDRRAVFEEASGITKFKADKKESLRKLEHTEANLLRLDDIIREVKRQIGSLQRQAGKARRYKSMRAEVRGLDIYIARKKIGDLEQLIKTLQLHQTELNTKLEQSKKLLAENEQKATELRAGLLLIEREIETTMQAGAAAGSKLNKARELIEVNSDRIEELTHLSERDSHDVETARVHLNEHSASLKKLDSEISNTVKEHDTAKAELENSTRQLRESEDRVEEFSSQSHNLRAESIELESRFSALQNEQTDIDAKERSTTIRRERLNAELAELENSVADFGKRQKEMVAKIDELQVAVDEAVESLEHFSGHKRDRERSIDDLKVSIGEMRSELAAKNARIELLRESDNDDEGFPGGARSLLNNAEDLFIDKEKILGSLADLFIPHSGYVKAVEVALRSWLDAVIMSDMPSALRALIALTDQNAGSVRILTSTGSKPPAPLKGSTPGIRLLENIDIPDNLCPLAERLIGNVMVVEDISEGKSNKECGAVFVTKSGQLFNANGVLELWMPTDEKANPLARKQLVREWEKETRTLSQKIETSQKKLTALNADSQSDSQKIEEARRSLEECRTNAAVARGEQQLIGQDNKQAHDRLETVRYELKAITETDSSARDRRGDIQKEMKTMRARQSEIRATVSELNEKLRDSEQRRSRLLSEVTDKRVAFSGQRQQVIHLRSRRDNLQSRISELEQLVQDRAAGIDSYKVRIENLENAIKSARESLNPLEAEARAHTEKLDETRMRRKEINDTLVALTNSVNSRREEIDNHREELSKTDVSLTEQRMRRENIVERVTEEYHLTPEQMTEEPEPEWDNGETPPQVATERRIAEIKAKIEQMGPVNLVAIDEHRELEDRFAFLKQQQEDLISSKEKLLTMIKHINKTTTEMFMKSFNSINEHFKELFKQIFGGGSARLALSEEGDVLESGIEIIARPPGKKLQTVSLLSGGERTMTAIALLFALYQEKPSAFCLLDELDAALDESNIDRFLHVVKRFLDKSQFIVITHSQKTIAAADVLYGVTMEERGVSKIISVKFHGKQLDLPAPETK